MPRAPRIETNDSLYHVINRGNYRSRIFEEEGARKAFEACLFEACERFGWELMAYCLMHNHFHLCLATPRGGLSEGMRWLQSTYAARFNRFRKEKGHLFQGRFKSLLVEEGKRLAELIAYIHLNPARAGIADASQLSRYRWSSLYWLPKRKIRPSFFNTSWLGYLEGMSDSAGGWRKYAISLQMRASDDPKEIESLDREMNRGWCIGGTEFKRALAKEYLEKKETLRLEKEALADLNETHWERALESCLRALGETKESAKRAKLSESWKLAIASKMKSDTSVTNAWLSGQLDLGVPRAVSSNCSVYARRRAKCEHFRKLKNITYDD